MKKYQKFNIGVFLIFNILYFIFAANASAAFPTYPVSSLGDCRDARECRLYCNIPANFPACWSYGKYILNKDVLGDAAINLTFPIAELGNCGSAQDCFLYCNQPQNQATCLSYARKSGLVRNETASSTPANMDQVVQAAKTELGCDGKDACMALCNNPANMDKCRSFAQKHGLESETGDKISNEVMSKAKTLLGCNSRDTCDKFCQNPQNSGKCLEFAKSNNLIDEKEAKKIETMRESGKKMLETAREKLNCDSQESCFKLCSDPQLRDKCINLAKQFNMSSENMQPEGNPDGNRTQPVELQSANDTQPPCASESDCRQYCRKHPDKCPGFPKNQTNAIQNSNITPPFVSGVLQNPNQMQRIQPQADPNFQSPSGAPNQQFNQPQESSFSPSGFPKENEFEKH